jgi:hypothetical protein
MIMVFWGIFILLIGSNRRLKYFDRSFFGYRVCANLAWGLIWFIHAQPVCLFVLFLFRVCVDLIWYDSIKRVPPYFGPLPRVDRTRSSSLAHETKKQLVLVSLKRCRDNNKTGWLDSIPRRGNLPTWAFTHSLSPSGYLNEFYFFFLNFWSLLLSLEKTNKEIELNNSLWAGTILARYSNLICARLRAMEIISLGADGQVLQATGDTLPTREGNWRRPGDGDFCHER